MSKSPINPWKLQGYKPGQNVVCRVTHAEPGGYAVLIPKDNLPGFLPTGAVLRPNEEILAQFVCVHNNRILLSARFSNTSVSIKAPAHGSVNWSDHLDDVDQADASPPSDNWQEQGNTNWQEQLDQVDQPAPAAAQDPGWGAPSEPESAPEPPPPPAQQQQGWAAPPMQPQQGGNTYSHADIADQGATIQLARPNYPEAAYQQQQSYQQPQQQQSYQQQPQSMAAPQAPQAIAAPQPSQAMTAPQVPQAMATPQAPQAMASPQAPQAIAAPQAMSAPAQPQAMPAPAPAPTQQPTHRTITTHVQTPGGATDVPVTINKTDEEVAFDVWAASQPRQFHLKRATDLVPPPMQEDSENKFAIADYDLEWLITDLEGGMRTGVVKASCESKLSRAAMLLYKGRAVGCIYGCKSMPEAQPTTEQALSFMLGDLEQPDTVVRVYDLPEAVTLAMSALFQGYPVQRHEEDPVAYMNELCNWFSSKTQTACLAVTPSTKATCLAFFHKGEFCGTFYVEDQRFAHDFDSLLTLVKSDPQTTIDASILPPELLSSAVRFGFSLNMSWQRNKAQAKK